MTEKGSRKFDLSLQGLGVKLNHQDLRQEKSTFPLAAAVVGESAEIDGEESLALSGLDLAVQILADLCGREKAD